MESVIELIGSVTALVVAIGGVLGIVLHVTGPAHQPDGTHTKTPAP